AEEVALRFLPNRTHVAGTQIAQNLVQHVDRLMPGLPLNRRAQEVFLGDHLKDWDDILRHPSMNQHETVLELFASLQGNNGGSQSLVLREEPSAANAKLGVA